MIVLTCILVINFILEQGLLFVGVLHPEWYQNIYNMMFIMTIVEFVIGGGIIYLYCYPLKKNNSNNFERCKGPFYFKRLNKA